MLGNGFINKPVGNPDKHKNKQTPLTANDSSSTFDWSIEEEKDTKVTKYSIENKVRIEEEPLVTQLCHLCVLFLEYYTIPSLTNCFL